MYSNKKICATIEVRMTSSRLPGKVLMDIMGKPAVQHIIERVKRSQYIDEVVVATTVNPLDDPIVELCRQIGCKYYRGSEEDVLLRVLDAAKSVDADIIVEIVGDCLVVDWRIADKLIEAFFAGEYHYASNALERTYPLGFNVQVFPVSVLDEVDRLTKDPVDHEHVTFYIYNHPEKFRLFNMKAPESMTYPHIEITLDTKEDYEMIKSIYEELYTENTDFSAEEVVSLLLDKPEILKIADNVKRRNPYEQRKMQEKQDER